MPVGLAPLIRSASGLYVSRFFIGILGGTFVPCQVWTTAFFDKNIVGSANALTGGFGNAGGGITYFIMPAVFNALVDHGGYGADTAWRIAFLVPLSVLLATGVALLVLCPDTPDGCWSARAEHAEQHLAEHIAHARGQEGAPSAGAGDGGGDSAGDPSKVDGAVDGSVQDIEAAAPAEHALHGAAHEVRQTREEMLETARGELVVPPTCDEVRQVVLSQHTWALMLTYAASFGTELAINAMLAAYYMHKFPHLGQTGAANWAAMFGFLNFVTRPLGGVVADVLYGETRRRGAGVKGGVHHHRRSLWWKRHWITACGVLGGVALVVVGRVDPGREAATFGLVALGAVFIEAGNGANFALVPHVHPFANGVVSGLTGAAGNLGGVVFSVIFRFATTDTAAGSVPDYARAFWIIGAIHIGLYAATSWVPPIPRSQVGGH